MIRGSSSQGVMMVVLSVQGVLIGEIYTSEVFRM